MNARKALRTWGEYVAAFAIVTFIIVAVFRIAAAQTGPCGGGAQPCVILTSAPIVNGAQVAGYVAPCYQGSVAGQTLSVPCPSTYHAVAGTCTFAAATTCTPPAFTGNNVFTSGTTYECDAGSSASYATTGSMQVASQTATGFTINAATSNSTTVFYYCQGW